MSSMMEDIEHLSKKIGARPAGTEEERLAAMYIGENIQKRSGLGFDIEDFEGAKGNDRATNFLPIISSVLLFFGCLLQLLAIPVLIITLVLAVLAVLEFRGKPVISKFFRFGISQNVVSKFIPTYSADNPRSQRKRKVILISHYDTGKCFSGSSNTFLKINEILKLIPFALMFLIPILMLIKIVAFPDTSGSFNITFIILSMVFILISLFPIFFNLYKSRLLYSEGANCNASANAALIEIAKQINNGSYESSNHNNDSSNDPVVHGEDFVKKNGVVDDSVNITYNTTSNADNKTEATQDPLSQKENSFKNAKAALAAFTAPRKNAQKFDSEGNPISASSQDSVKEPDKSDQESREVHNAGIVSEAPKVADASSTEKISIPQTASSSSAFNSSPSVPEWFKTAQNRAHEGEEKDAPKDDKDDNAQRSRYAKADDLIKKRQEEALEKQKREEEIKRQKLREQIAAAQKAAEEERQKHFGNNKPFFRNEQDAEQTTEIKKTSDSSDSAKEDLTLDERLKLRQIEDKNKSAASNIPENSTNSDSENISEDNSIKSKDQIPELKPNFAPQNTANDNSSNDNVKNANIDKDESKEGEDKTNSYDNKSDNVDTPAPSPENSGQINLEKMQQYAPLADQSFISSNEMPKNDSLKEIPEVYSDEELAKENTTNNNTLDDSENNVHETTESTDDVEKGKFGTGSFAAISQNEGMAGATGTFSPVTEELIEDASKSGKLGKKDDIVVGDADDSVYSKGEYTDTGAFAGKGYVDMPEDGRKGIFGVFGKKKDKEKGNEDEFSGKHSHNHKKKVKKSKHAGDKLIDDTAWEGGAFQGLGDKISSTLNPAGKYNADDTGYDSEQDSQVVDDQEYVENSTITNPDSKISPMIDAVPDFEGQIQEFHNSSLNIEVWMVALGSEIDENSGIRTFIMEHSQELNGAIIIDIEAIGQGELCFVESEGLFGSVKTSPRLKRFVRQAANKLGLSVPAVSMPWNRSSSLYASKFGIKTLRFCGVKDGEIANKMSIDDTIDNIDENILKQNIAYLLELIQCI